MIKHKSITFLKKLNEENVELKANLEEERQANEFKTNQINNIMKDYLNSTSELQNQLSKIEKLKNKNKELQEKLLKNGNVSTTILEKKKKESQKYLVRKERKKNLNLNLMIQKMIK